jgi:peptidoglycan-N-acetylglucosamine deacetylase
VGVARRVQVAVVVVGVGVLSLATPNTDAADSRGLTLVHETPGSQWGSSDPVVSITFDDGPNAVWTPRVLDVLARYGEHGTFFQLGSEASRYPSLSRAVVDAGHTVANHTWNHVNLTTLPWSSWGNEVGATTDLLESTTGQQVVCTRPPGGASNSTVVSRLASYGQASVLWTNDTRDFERPGVSTIISRALSDLRNGSIILLHDGGGDRSQTVAALPSIIEGIRARGFRIVPICGRTAPRWHGAEVVPGGNGVRSSPDAAAVRGWRRVDAGVRGTDGNVYLNRWDGWGWSGYWSIGSPGGLGIRGNPALVSWAPGRLDVFVHGHDDRLWQRFSTDGGWSWSRWFKPVGDSGTLASGPDVVAWAPGRLDVFVRGTDGLVYHRFWSGWGWNGEWLPHGAPPGLSASGDPAAASWAPNRLDLFVRGSDGGLWQQFWDGSQWSGWMKPTGNAGALAAPDDDDGGVLDAASWGAGHVTVFARGTDGLLYQTTYRNGWSSWWAPFPNAFQGGPGVTSVGDQQLDVLVRGTDDHAYRFWYR